MRRPRTLCMTLAVLSLALPAAADVAGNQDKTQEQTMASDVERVKIDSPKGDFSMTFEKPTHWMVADLPPEATADTDFSDLMKFTPVCLIVDPKNQETRPPMFMVAARPAYPDGSVTQWLEAICENQKLKHGPISQAKFGDSAAVYCHAQMSTDDNARMLVVLLEDGGRLINLAFITPTDQFEANEETLNTFLNSFRLVDPKGATAPLEDTGTAKASNDLALADDTSTLSQENPINANLMNNGVGFVPNVVKTDDATKTATLACGALQGFIDLPYGWHVIDDGKRVLIFDPQNLTQINCAMVPRDGADDRAILEKTLESLQQESPGFESKIDEIEGNLVLMVRDVVIEGEKTQQAYMLAAAADPDYAVKIRISSTGDMKHVVRSINVGEQIKKTLRR